jgi:hypothetical protein
VLDERPASRAMQHLRQRGFQSRTFSCRQNHNYEVGICHARILNVSRVFDNPARTGAVRIEHFIGGTQKEVNRDFEA